MSIRSKGLSDIGQKRQVNEDSFLRDDRLGFYIVADGVGGHAKGEVASAQAVEEAYGFIRRESALIEAYRTHPTEENRYALRRLLESAIQSACYMIFGLAEMDPEHLGMSTTVSSLLVVDDLGILGQVGDSRIYRCRSGHTEQLTEDHTLVNYKLKHGLITPEEASRSPGRNVITRAVGHRDYVQVDTLLIEVAKGDRFMLCSDGLHTYLEDPELPGLLHARPIDLIARNLIQLANQRGGKDNITVLLVEVLP